MQDKREKTAKQRARQLLSDRERRIQLLLAAGRILDAKDIPADAIPVDFERSTLARTMFPVLCYQDIHFVCSNCGHAECWTAASQQHYFEVKQGSPFNKPKRCYDCRQKELERRLRSREESRNKGKSSSSGS